MVASCSIKRGIRYNECQNWSRFLMVIIYSIYTAVCYFIVEFGGFVLKAAVVANFPEFVNAF